MEVDGADVVEVDELVADVAGDSSPISPAQQSRASAAVAWQQEIFFFSKDMELALQMLSRTTTESNAQPLCRVFERVASQLVACMRRHTHHAQHA